MKVLIAADGKTLEGNVAKRFGKARWYLVVDSDTNDVEQFPNLKFEDHHDIVPKAVERGVDTVITGNVGPRSFELISFHNLRIALARNMSGQDAIQRLNGGTLKILDAPTVLKNMEEQEILRKGARDQSRRGSKSPRGKSAYVSGTPRGQHHLQQYGGRGH